MITLATAINTHKFPYSNFELILVSDFKALSSPIELAGFASDEDVLKPISRKSYIYQ